MPSSRGDFLADDEGELVAGAACVGAASAADDVDGVVGAINGLSPAEKQRKTTINDSMRKTPSTL